MGGGEVMNGHVLYSVDDFKHLTGEEMDNNRIAELVLDGGLCICKICHDYELGLDKPCRGRKFNAR